MNKNGIIYNLINHFGIIDGVNCSCRIDGRCSGRSLIWRRDCVYCVNSIYYEVSYQKKKKIEGPNIGSSFSREIYIISYERNLNIIKKEEIL